MLALEQIGVKKGSLCCGVFRSNALFIFLQTPFLALPDNLPAFFNYLFIVFEMDWDFKLTHRSFPGSLPQVSSMFSPKSQHKFAGR